MVRNIIKKSGCVSVDALVNTEMKLQVPKRQEIS
jgi:hypothetical protein